MSEEYDLAPETTQTEYEVEKQRLQQFFAATAVKHAVHTNRFSQDAERREVLPQYGLLGFQIGENGDVSERELLYVNVDAPNSVFICGSQGSGISYTLSCMLENCLLSNPDIGKLHSPVAGVVFHYDVNSTPSPAEAAHLCSRGIPVNVFVSRSNERALTKVYNELSDQYENLKVQPLMFRSVDLGMERMNKLMAIGTKEGPPPLYMEVVQRILREMAIKSEVFDYLHFKRLLAKEQLTKDQTSLMSLRLTVLERFMDPAPLLGSGRVSMGRVSTGMKEGSNKGSFTPQPGSLTIIDLSDPFVDSSTACLLFYMCLVWSRSKGPKLNLLLG